MPAERAASERTPAQPDFDVREAVEAGEALQGHLGQLEDQINYLSALLTEFSRSKAGLEALAQLQAGDEVLLSLGGGNFVRAKLAEQDKVISGIGSGLSIEGPVADAVARAEAQLQAAREGIQRLQEEAQRTLQQMQALEARLAQVQG